MNESNLKMYSIRQFFGNTLDCNYTSRCRVVDFRAISDSRWNSLEPDPVFWLRSWPHCAQSFIRARRQGKPRALYCAQTDTLLSFFCVPSEERKRGVSRDKPVNRSSDTFYTARTLSR